MASDTLTRTVFIDDIEQLGGKLNNLKDWFVKFSEDFTKLRAMALQVSLHMGYAEGEIKKRTPMSNRQRYGYSYRKDGSRAKKALPKRMVHGNLRQSYVLRLVRNAGDECEVKIGYEGVEYANRLHELDLHHKWDPSAPKDGGWTLGRVGNKFVQKPLEDAGDKIALGMMRTIDTYIRRYSP